MNITQAEQALESTIINTWDRIRSTAELQSFAERKLALVGVQSDEFAFLD